MTKYLAETSAVPMPAIAAMRPAASGVYALSMIFVPAGRLVTIRVNQRRVPE